MEKIDLLETEYLDVESDDCEECDNERRRGDEFYDKYCTACDEFNELDERYNNLADRLLEVMHINGQLRILLAENGVKHDL